MTYILERHLDCERKRLRMLRKLYATGDPTVKAKEVIDAHQSVESIHRAIAKKRCARAESEAA